MQLYYNHLRKLGITRVKYSRHNVSRRFGTMQLQQSVPAHFLRGGTSKGVFLSSSNLPTSRLQRDKMFLRLMGSPDAQYQRQLNGMGGGISSLSKIVIVEPSSPTELAEKGVHIRYDFVQIGIKDNAVDYSGNCGNLSSMVGVYALWSSLVQHDIVPVTATEDGTLRATIRAINTNTNKLISTTFPVIRTDSGLLEPVLDLHETEMAGVPGKASAIALNFIDPSGARTGKLLPTGNALDHIDIGGETIRASMVDATNPTVFVNGDDLKARQTRSIQPYDFSSKDMLHTLETCRQEAASRMGLDPSAQAQPKISVLTRADHEVSGGAHIVAHTLSMGVLHKAIPMTVGLCLGVAANIPGTVAFQMTGNKGKNLPSSLVRIQHPSGEVEVGAETQLGHDGVLKVLSAKVIRTGKRLMSGTVWL